MEKLDDIVFYAIDKAIRCYRQYAQKQIKEAGFTITVDQWLVIKAIQENPTIPQQEISVLVFKDNASVTRIIGNLIKAGYLDRKLDENDRRRTKLTITREGRKVIDDVQQIIDYNRAKALEGISATEVQEVQRIMNKISENTSR